jgi:hypothetical protein
MDSNNDVHPGTIIEHLVSSNKTTSFSVGGRPKMPSHGAMRHRGLEEDDDTGPAPSREKRSRLPRFSQDLTKYPEGHAPVKDLQEQEREVVRENRL